MNDVDLCLEVVSRSRQPLRYIWRWISRKPLEIEAWFQMTTNRKWHMGYGMVTWRSWKVKFVTPIGLQRNISKTVWASDFKFGVHLWECRAAAQIILHKSGRGLGHVAHTISIDFFSDSGQNNAMLTRIVVQLLQYGSHYSLGTCRIDYRCDCMEFHGRT